MLTAVFRAPHYTRHFTEQLLTSQPAAVPDEAELRPPRSAPRGGAGQTAGAGGHPLKGTLARTLRQLGCAGAPAAVS